jgi:hypothetical protein
MKKNYLFLTVIMLLASVQMMFAQNRSIIDVNQVLVVSGGAFSNPDDYVTAASYKPNDSITTEFGTVFTQSVQSAVVYDHFLYVAAQDSIVAFDIDSYQRVAATAAAGVNQLAVAGEKLIATFWYPNTAGFVKIYNRADLSELAVISDVSDEAAGIAIDNNRAYVAVPGGWAATSGKLAVIDLTTNSFLEEIDLGTEGAGINNVYVYTANDTHYLVTVNKTPWGGNSGYLTKINLADMSIINVQVDVVLGKGVGFTQSNATLYALVNGGVGSINVDDLTVTDTSIVAAPAMAITGAAYDSIHSLFYITTTDYASVGEGTIYNMDGEVAGSFDAGISAEAIAIDYRDFESVGEIFAANTFRFYPNPVRDELTVANQNRIAINQIIVSDIMGRVVASKYLYGREKVVLDMSNLNAGLYFVTVMDEHKSFTSKIVKK